MTNVTYFLSPAERNGRLFELALDVMGKNPASRSGELRTLLVERIKNDPQMIAAALSLAAESFIGE